MEQATELEFLQFFYSRARDYMGPADADCYEGIKEDFVRFEKKALPEGYGEPS
jgi:hypothetical protein